MEAVVGWTTGKTPRGRQDQITGGKTTRRRRAQLSIVSMMPSGTLSRRTFREGKLKVRIGEPNQIINDTKDRGS